MLIEKLQENWSMISGYAAIKATITFPLSVESVLLEQVVSALRATDTDPFKRWYSDGVQDLEKVAAEELLHDWFAPFLTEVERDGLVAWHLGVSF